MSAHFLHISHRGSESVHIEILTPVAIVASRMQTIPVQQNRIRHVSSLDRPGQFRSITGNKVSQPSTFLPNNVTFAGDGKESCSGR